MPVSENLHNAGHPANTILTKQYRLTVTNPPRLSFWHPWGTQADLTTDKLDHR
jgi:hypothetical protein